MERLEDRTIPSIDLWTGNLSLDWNNAGNWSLGHVPGPSDDVQINSASGAIVHGSGDAEISSLTTAVAINLSGGDIRTDSGGVTLQNGAVFTITNNSILAFEDVNQSLSGAGEVVFGDSNASNRVDVEGATTLTIGSGITIDGNSGGVGTQYYALGNDQIINNGIISADVSGGTINLLPNGGCTNNANATLSADNGGTLLLESNITNDGGVTIGSDDATSTVEQYGVSITGGTINAGNGLLVSNNGNNLLNGVSITGNLNLTDDAQEYVTGGLVLNGTATLTGTGNGNGRGLLAFQGSSNNDSQTLSGNATILFGDSSPNELEITPVIGNETTTLILGPDVLIHGQTGIIGVGSIGNLINNGTVDADDASGTPGTITVLVRGAATANNGTLEASHGGTLLLQSNITDVGAGTITSDATGTVEQDGATINGGTLQFAGNGLLAANNGNNVLNGVTINGNLNLTDDGLEYVTGGLVLNGTATLTGTGNGNGRGLLAFQGSSNNDSQTLSGNATILFGDSSPNELEITPAIGNETTTLILGPDVLIHGQTGIIGAGSIGNLINNGAIDADDATGTPGTITLEVSGTTTNNGALEASNGGTLLLGCSITNASTGTISSDAASTVEQDGVTINGGTLQFAGNGLGLLVTNNSNNLLNGVSITGNLNLTDDGQEYVTGGLVLNGTATLTGTGNGNGRGLLAFQGSSDNDSQTLSGNATILFGDSSPNELEITPDVALDTTTLILGANVLIHGQTGIIGVGAYCNLVNNGAIAADADPGAGTINLQVTSFTNNGTIDVVNGSTLDANVGAFTNNGSVTIDGTHGSSQFVAGVAYTQSGASSNTTLVSGGTLQSTTNIINIQGGTLQGAGTVIGNVTNSGTIAPGTNTATVAGGIMSITGNYTQDPGGNFAIDISSASAIDQLKVSGTATFAGAVSAVLLNGFLPTVGASFNDVIDFASESGSFTPEYIPVGSNLYLQQQFNPGVNPVRLNLVVLEAPTINNGPPPTSATVGTPYTFTYMASGSPAPTFNVTSGALPTGLSLNSTTGAITGMPTTAATFTGVVTASNIVGSFTQNFSIVVVALPIVSDVSPAQGPMAGGTVVTITGTNLANATAVDFGSSQVTSFTSDTATSITLNSPTVLLASIVDVRVVTAGGTSAINAPGDQFTFASTVVAVVPSVPTITGAQVGTVGFVLSVTYSSPMNTSVFPTIAFSPSVSSTLTLASKSWDTTGTIFSAVYNVADADTPSTSCDVTVTGAKSATGVSQIAFNANNVFTINTADPVLLSVAPSVVTITNAQVGGAFTLALLYNEAMKTTVAPAVTFSPSVATTLVSQTGNWNATHRVYTVSYKVAGASVLASSVGITVTGAQDANSNPQLAAQRADVFAIDTVTPLVTSIMPSVPVIADAQLGSAAFSLAIQYGETMNTKIAPAISIAAASTTVTLASGSWDGTHTLYTASYNVAHSAVSIPNVAFTVSGAKNLDGNIQIAKTGTFAIDTVNPTVKSITPSVTALNDTHLGNAAFTLVVSFSSTMNTAVTPAISFLPPVSSTLTPAGGSWNSAHTIYTAGFTVTASGVSVAGESVAVSGAQNSDDNVAHPFEAVNLFSINMVAPTVLVVTPGVAVVTNAQVGKNGFSMAVNYSVPMNVAVTPMITFSPDVSSTLTLASTTWNATHTIFTAVYNVANAGVSLAAVQATVSGAASSAGNPQASFVLNSAFGISTTLAQAPNIAVAANNTIDCINSQDFGESFVATTSGPLAQLNVLNITNLYNAQAQSLASTGATLEIFQGGINSTNPSLASYDTPAGSLLYSQDITFGIGDNNIVLSSSFADFCA